MPDYKARLGVHKNNYSQRQFLSENLFFLHLFWNKENLLKMVCDKEMG